MAVCTNFYKKYLQNLKYSVKRAYIFHLILVDILSILILFVKNRWLGGGGRELLNRENSLSVTKAIYRQSLKGHSLDKYEFFKNPN